MRLREWQDANGKKVSTTSTAPQVVSTSGQVKASSATGFKERFLKLLTYHIMHRKKTATSYKVKTLTDDSFFYEEHHKNLATGTEYDVEYSVDIEVGNEAWRLIVRKDGGYPDDLRGTGWTNLLRELRPYMSIPTVGTPEYNKLLKETSIVDDLDENLIEWVDSKGKKVSMSSSTFSSQPASSKNYPSQEDRYRRLLAQIDSDKIVKYTVNLLDDRILAITLNNGVGVKIIFKPYVPCYLVQVDGHDTTCDDYEDVLKLLIIEGIISDTDLCESAGSIAEDFKLYENLWN